ncbi:MAG: malto-oligosyltrehalose trehalohydrolase [Actinobacteria bacterium]|nr:malto-oligosyltrehalose trehalohydrolase [Actinomycetota bacterium]
MGDPATSTDARGVHPLRHGPLLHGDGSATFRVWAPHARNIEVVLDGRSVPLTADGDGWHRARLPVTGTGRYAYRLDGGPPRPDPASLHQPDSVHEASALLDRSQIAWPSSEARWQAAPLSSAVIYELHVGTFTAPGTFAAAIEHLGALAALGVTHVEVMPVGGFNGPHGWGYDGVCWYAVHEPYGGPAGFAAFVAACHANGLGVILDVVYNHFGPSGSYHAEFGPYLTDRHRTPWGPAINLDGQGADAVRAFIVDNACMWLADFHVDGLRLDAVHALHDTSAPHILAELSATVDHLAERLRRPLALIAESDLQDPLTVQPRTAGGMGMTAQWLDDLHHALHVTVTGEQDGYYRDYTGLPDVAKAWTDGFVYDGRWSVHRQREVGAPLPEQVSGRQLVACIQNHDQIGNRAHGERLSTLVDPPRVRLAIALLCLAPTVPMLFMGEEYGETNPFLFFSSHPEPALAKAVRSGRRDEFAAFAAFDQAQVPDPQDLGTFARSTLDRTPVDTAAGQARHALWTDLLQLRRTEPALATGDRTLTRSLLATQSQMAVLRDDPAGDAPVIVVANAGAEDVTVTLDVDSDWEPRWSSAAPAYGGSGSPATVERRDSVLLCLIPAWTVGVLTSANP